MPCAVGVMADSYNKPASGFDPLSIPWHSVFWASNPSWTPPADGAGVANWKNSGTVAVNAVQGVAGAQPTYRAAYANLNGKPAVEFGLGDVLQAAPHTSIAQPNHVFAVAVLNAGAPATATLFDGWIGRHFVRNQTNGNIDLYAGAVVTVTGAGRTGPYCLSVLYNGASSTLRMRGNAYTVTGTVGASGLDGLMIGSYDTSNTYTHVGAIAFFGVSDTALTGQNVTDLETWAKNFYGVTIP